MKKMRLGGCGDGELVLRARIKILPSLPCGAIGYRGLRRFRSYPPLGFWGFWEAEGPCGGDSSDRDREHGPEDDTDKEIKRGKKQQCRYRIRGAKPGGGTIGRLKREKIEDRAALEASPPAESTRQHIGHGLDGGRQGRDGSNRTFVLVSRFVFIWGAFKNSGACVPCGSLGPPLHV